ncbi:hypothetical protein MSAN_02452300 [Mycena sanguinolenta]|uniref:Uncharacterized protein n=1 Tax=Mycena sanguinolenta TaxID=230812 RepID=A0A8H7CAX6_9AGAR|nr:hypothetical protein MSAN_02452300 [Mycena sanguinolenta]
MIALPPELEREIFETCAFSRPVSIPKLMLVAQYVKEWVEPLLYRTILTLGYNHSIEDLPRFTEATFSSMLRRKSPVFFQNAVRHFMLMGLFNYSKVEAILTLCTGVEDLCILDIPESWMPFITSFPLRRLYTSFRAIPLTHPIFSRLTHLHLQMDDNTGDTESTCTILATLPKLTHLSFSGGAFVALSHKILALSRSICVLVLIQQCPSRWIDAEVTKVVRDVRFVVMPHRNFIEDWYTGVRGGKCYWSDAETFVAKRQTREIDPQHFFWP